MGSLNLGSCVPPPTDFFLKKVCSINLILKWSAAIADSKQTLRLQTNPQIANKLSDWLVHNQKKRKKHVELLYRDVFCL